MGTSAAYAAQYQSITVDARDGYPDLHYVNHVVTYDSPDAEGAWNLVTLTEDTGVLPDLTSDVRVYMTSTYQNFGVTLPDPARAYFTGGLVDLTFNYNGVARELKGPISEGSMMITHAEDAYSVISAKFQFDTNAAGGVENLPGSGIWPATGKSTAVALTLYVGGNLSAMETDPAAWDVNLPNVTVRPETLFNYYPAEMPIPEPTGLALLALGALALLRRRA